ncbi:MAG: hypothetical protein ACRC4M_02730 [Mycoplasma sp.]
MERLKRKIPEITPSHNYEAIIIREDFLPLIFRGEKIFEFRRNETPEGVCKIEGVNFELKFVEKSLIHNLKSNGKVFNYNNYMINKENYNWLLCNSKDKTPIYIYKWKRL